MKKIKRICAFAMAILTQSLFVPLLITSLAVGVTLIYNANQLDDVRSNLSGEYRLMEDVDLAGWGNWEPIGTIDVPFSGIFDGNGHIVKNITVNHTEMFGGFFGHIEGATIKNFGLEGGTISVACMNPDTLPTRPTGRAGGIAGGAINSTISNCYNTASVTAKHLSSSSSLDYNLAVGGIVGATQQSQISNCYNKGTVRATDAYKAYTGGIAGYIQDGTMLINCMSFLENTTSSSNVGANWAGNICAVYNDEEEQAVSKSINCYCLNRDVPFLSFYGIHTNDRSVQYDVTALSAANMRNVASYSGIDFDNVWVIDGAINGGFPSLRMLGIEVVVPPETPDIQVGRDTWSFKNLSDKIPLIYYNYWFDTEKAIAVSKKDDGTLGQCAGMVMTAININDNLPTVDDFYSNTGNRRYDWLSNLQKEDYTYMIDKTASDYIKHGQIFQHTDLIREEREKNWNDLLSLYNAVKAYEENKGNSVAIGVYGRWLFQNGGHALWGIATKDYEDRSIIWVYDCNDPNNNDIGIVLHKDSSGDFVSWEYQFDVFTKWGTGKENAWITYHTLSNELYSELSQGDKNVNTNRWMESSIDYFTVSTNGKVASVINKESTDNEVIARMRWEAASQNPDDNELYWFRHDVGSNVIISEISQQATFKIIDNSSSVEGSLPANSTIDFHVKDEDKNSAKISNITNPENVSILFSRNGKDKIKVEGIAQSSEVSAIETANGIAFTGEGTFTVTAEKNGKTTTTSFSSLSEQAVSIDVDNSSKITIAGGNPSSTPIVIHDTYAMRYRGTTLFSYDEPVTWNSGDSERLKVTAIDEKSCEVESLRNFTKLGAVTITATSLDGQRVYTTDVSISPTWWQWLIIVLLFGWIWY